MEHKPDEQIKLSLEDQVKVAERDKLIAETEKIKADRNRRWWVTAQFWKGLITSIIGLTFLGFVVTYILIPFHNYDTMQGKIDNLDLSLKNKMDAEKLYENEITFKNKERAFIHYTDSIQIELNNKRSAIDSLKNSRDFLILGYEKLIKTYKEENNTKIQAATKELLKLKKDYEEQSDAYEKALRDKAVLESAISQTSSVRFDFYDIKGKSLILKNAQIQIYPAMGIPIEYESVYGDNLQTELLANVEYSIEVNAKGLYSDMVIFRPGRNNSDTTVVEIMLKKGVFK